MCGIVGIVSFNDGPAPHRELWPQLVNHLRHRGPDEGAFWSDDTFFFGHRRLSIIDLQGGDQPMATENRQLVVTFNGEIYNYVELREQLEAMGHRFRTTSDTEVLLHGYRAWGEQLPSHLIGMFAFAIADRQRRELFVARDRFGEKPLFLLQQAEYLAFASEMRPLCALPDLDRRIDEEALGAYLSLNYVPGDATMLRSIRRLPPASWALYDRCGKRRSDRYWQPPKTTDTYSQTEQTLDAWREHFDRAVSLCLRSDVPVGVLLSGGMDSSLIAESAVRQGKLQRAYFIDFAEGTHSERQAAETVAERLDLPLQTVTISEQAVGDTFFDLVEHADDPLADSSAVPVWAVSRLAAGGNKVVLGGDGGDELFAGYLTYTASQMHHYVIARLPRLLRGALARAADRIPTSEGKVSFSYKLWRFLRAADLPGQIAHLTWNGTWLPAEAASLVNPAARQVVGAALGSVPRRHGLDEHCDLLALQRNDVAEYLPNDILTKVDRMSMAHGLEVRAPFLDHQLASWALSRADRHKVGLLRSQQKRMLRLAARQVFGPEIADRPKQGFSIPVHKWLRGKFASTVADLLSPASLARFELLDAPAVTRVVDAHMSGKRSYGFELWGLAVLMAWHRCRVQAPPPPPRDWPLVERQF